LGRADPTRAQVRVSGQYLFKTMLLLSRAMKKFKASSRVGFVETSKFALVRKPSSTLEHFRVDGV